LSLLYAVNFFGSPHGCASNRLIRLGWSFGRGSRPDIRTAYCIYGTLTTRSTMKSIKGGGYRRLTRSVLTDR